MTYEERYHSFAQYLRDRQVEHGAVPRDFIDSIPDKEMMEAYRKNHEDGKDFYSEEQERSVIMEYGSNEAIYEALEGIKSMNHLDSIEKDLVKEFSGSMRTIAAKEINAGKLNSLLKDFENIGVKIEHKYIDEALVDCCAGFVQWVLEGCKYYVREEEDQRFELDYDLTCPACLLNEILHRYKTLLGWSQYADVNIDDDESFVEYVSSRTFCIIQDGIPDPLPDNWAESLDKKRFESLVSRLFEVFLDYLMRLPLISCWLLGKEVGQKRKEEDEEARKFLSYTHDYFCEKYQSCLKTGTEDQFFKDLEDYLKTLPIEQLETLYDEGFPVDVTNKQAKKINRLVGNLIKSLKPECHDKSN